MSVWQEAETDFFLPCLCFFQLAKNWLCCPYTEKYSCDPSKRHQTAHGLFAGNFGPLTPLKFLFPLSDIIHLVHSDLLWVEYRWKRPVYYLCYPIQGLHDVFGVAESICVGRGRPKLLVSSPAKGAPFLSKLFINRKIEKGEVWSLFGIVFAHGNGTIPQFHLFFFQNKRLCCVFIPLSLVLML